MNIPFPPGLARISATNAKTGYESRKAQPAGDHRTANLAAYRLPSGEVRTAYDAYNPEYPEEATPGLADVFQRLHHYPNDTSGYTASCSNFRAIDELAPSLPDWGRVAVALVRKGGRECFAMGRDEADLQSALSGLQEDGARIFRTGRQQLHDIASDEVPTVAISVTAAAGTHLHMAASEEALVAGLAERFSFLDLGDRPLEEATDMIMAHGGQYGWAVSAGRLDPDNPELARMFEAEEAGPGI